MNNIESRSSVVVTDIRMPFWSMVIFMVKFAVAAVPALLLLSIIGWGVTTAFIAALASLPGNKTTSAAVSTSPLYQSTPPAQAQVQYPPNTPERCKGSPNFEKCVEQERRLSGETPEARAKRQQELEAERRENMSKIK